MPEFFKTLMGRKFYESDVPALVSTLKRIATALEERNVKPAEDRDLILQSEERDLLFHMVGTHFVATDDGLVYCEKCAKGKGIDLWSDGTNLWEVLGDDWLNPVVCAGCDLSIPVFVTGNPEDERAHRKPKERK